MYYSKNDVSPGTALQSLREQSQHFGHTTLPRILWILCSEPCMNPVVEANFERGVAYQLRWPGNYPRDSRVAEKTLEYAVQELGVTEIIVCGHSFCRGTEGSSHPADGTKQKNLSLFERASHGQSLTQRAKVNVIEQVESIQSNFALGMGEANSQVKVHGLFYLTESHLFLMLDQGHFIPLANSPVDKELKSASR